MFPRVGGILEQVGGSKGRRRSSRAGPSRSTRASTDAANSHLKVEQRAKRSPDCARVARRCRYRGRTDRCGRRCASRVPGFCASCPTRPVPSLHPGGRAMPRQRALRCPPPAAAGVDGWVGRRWLRGLGHGRSRRAFRSRRVTGLRLRQSFVSVDRGFDAGMMVPANTERRGGAVHGSDKQFIELRDRVLVPGLAPTPPAGRSSTRRCNVSTGPSTILTESPWGTIGRRSWWSTTRARPAYRVSRTSRRRSTRWPIFWLRRGLAGDR